MKKVPFLDYRSLNSFYSIAEACKLLKMTKRELHTACYNYGIDIRCNKSGKSGLLKSDFITLHRFLYHEKKQKQTRRG